MKAVLFDFWGTLVENGIFPSPVKQVKYILRINTPFSEYITKFEQSFMTRKFENLSKAFEAVIKDFNLNPPAFVNDKLVGMWNKNTILAKPFPDTIDVLKGLKERGIKTCLISNTDQFSVEQVLDKFEMRDLFDVIMLSYEEGKLKSDPELFDKALKRMQVDKEEAVMVGDSIDSDIKGARKAGLKAILIDRKDQRDHEEKIISLTELMDKV